MVRHAVHQAGGGETEKDMKYRKVTVQNIFQEDIKAFFHGVLPWPHFALAKHKLKWK